MKLDTIQDVFVDQLGDLRSAEAQLVEALPRLAAAASDPELSRPSPTISRRRGATCAGSRTRSGRSPSASRRRRARRCRACSSEADEIIAAHGDGLAKDAALIAAAQRVEHYEIAAYGTVRTLAEQLDYTDARRMFDDTLDEEASADRRLTKLATGGRLSSGINERAAPR